MMQLHSLYEKTTSLFQIQPYVNGTLYSLLGHGQIAGTAKSIGLDKELEHMHNHGDPDTKRQLEYILDQLNNQGQQNNHSSTEDEEVSTISDEEDDESMEEDIDIEEEIDVNDPIAPDPGELFGVEFLEQNYIVETGT